MSWEDDTLGWVYDRTDGHCRYCGKKLFWSNYGAPGERGSWEVDHSVPIARGGTDYLRNLWPACTDCNRDKGAMTGSQYMRLMEGGAGPYSSSDSIVGGLAALFFVVLLLKVLQGGGSRA